MEVLCCVAMRRCAVMMEREIRGGKRNEVIGKI